MIFMQKGTKVHPRLRVTNLVTRYELPKRSCVIRNKSACMNDDTWGKLVKLLAPGIRKMKVSNFASVFPILLSPYLSIHICPSKFSSDDL